MEGSITLKITCAKSLDEQVKVTFKVIDTGIGIEKDKTKTSTGQNNPMDKLDQGLKQNGS